MSKCLCLSQMLFSCWILEIYVIQNVIPCFPCSVRNEYWNSDCNLFIDVIGTVIMCFVVERGDCLSWQVYGYIRSCCHQKVTGTLRDGINILQPVILFLSFLLFWSSRWLMTLYQSHGLFSSTCIVSVPPPACLFVLDHKLKPKSRMTYTNVCIYI